MNVSKVKTGLEKNERKTLTEPLIENSGSLNMKQFWNNINSFGFSKTSEDNTSLPNQFLVPQLKLLYSKQNINRDINLFKTGFPLTSYDYVNKYLQKDKNNNKELISKICGFNLYLKKNDFNSQIITDDINSNIKTLEKILSNIEDINYENLIKIDEYSKNTERLNLESKYRKGLYTPSSILTKENKYDYLIEQIYNLQMKQFADSIYSIHRKKNNGKWIYKVRFEINEHTPSLEMDEENYNNLIKFRGSLNYKSYNNLYQEKTGDFYNIDKISSKNYQLNIEEEGEKEIQLEEDTKNSKIELRAKKQHSNSNKRNNKNLFKKIKEIKENILNGDQENYQIAKRINIYYYYCHHCRKRLPAEFTIKCKSFITSKKQMPVISFVVNGTTIIWSK